ncbi:MAG: M50 family metallopeptidase [Tepidiformaceae bacterium]
MLGRNFRIARLGGISIEASPSWLFVLALISWTLADGALPDLYDGWSNTTYWVVGILSAVLLFVTVLLHELAHAVVAIRRGIPVPRITLFLFGGVSQLSEDPRTAREEFLIAVAGPVASIAIAAVTGLGALIAGQWNEQAEATLGYLAIVNVVLGVFNLLPGFPLDGGRVFRAMIWGRTGSHQKATRIAGAVGEMFGSLLMGFGLVLLLTGQILTGIWLGLIGWFISGAARQEAQGVVLERILENLTARDLMQKEFITAPPWLTLQRVVDDFFLGQSTRWLIVADDEAVHGILTISDLRKVDRAEWPAVSAQRVMTPRAEVTAVTAETPAIDVLKVVSEKGLNQVPVLEEGRMVGVITRRELLDRVDLEQRLRPPVARADRETARS